MSFKAYPKYKESGVEWLGRVPEHWEVRRIGSLFRQANATGREHLPILSVSIHHGVSDKELDEEESDRKVTRSDDRTKYKAVEPGDLVYNMMRAWQGGFGTVTVEGMVSPAYVVARPMTAIDTSFIERVFRTPAAIEHMRRCSYGVTDFRLRLYWEAFKTLEVPMPTPAELESISSFLDHETAKIDALIAEQQRLIELLQEKRQAVISHAVTKGLNPHAPMKDSGIEWLGEVPEHWEVRPLKSAILKIEQGWSPQCESYPAEEGEWGVLKVGCVNGDGFNAEEQKALPREIKPLPEYEVMEGDILASRGNTLELVGQAAFIPKVRERLMLSDLLYRFRPQPERAAGEFLVRALRSGYGRFQIERSATGTSASMKKVSQGGLKNLLIALPPLGEQRAILTSTSTMTDQIDRLADEARSAIALLQERRSALISAAVTGQIDVRGFSAGGGSEAA